MKVNLRLFEIILSIVIASIFITRVSNNHVKFEDFALGKGTSSVYATNDSYPIHIGKVNNQEFNSLKEGWEKRNKDSVYFVLGNSQTHGINQYKKGDFNYNKLLFDSLKVFKKEVLTHSIPNANLQEMLLSYSYFFKEFPIEYLIIPLFMDDLREDGIKDIFFTKLVQENYRIQDSSKIAQKINLELKEFQKQKLTSEAIKKSEKDFKALEKTTQEEVEKWFNNKLNQASNSWNKRKQLRGSIFTNLYLLRNTVFGIGAQTKRPLIKNRYQNNIAALKRILEFSNEKNIEQRKRKFYLMIS